MHRTRVVEIGTCPSVILRFADDINNSGDVVGHGFWNQVTNPGQPSQQIIPFDHAFVLVPVTTCYEDLDGDNDVDGTDLGILLAGYTSGCPGVGLCIADLNCTRTINGFDLAILNAAWGPCPGMGGGAGASAMSGEPESGESPSVGPPTLAGQVDWLIDHGMADLVPALIELWSQIDS